MRVSPPSFIRSSAALPKNPGSFVMWRWDGNSEGGPFLKRSRTVSYASLSSARLPQLDLLLGNERSLKKGLHVLEKGLDFVRGIHGFKDNRQILRDPQKMTLVNHATCAETREAANGGATR